MKKYRTPKQQAHIKAAAISAFGKNAFVIRLIFSGHYVGIAANDLPDYPHDFEVIKTYKVGVK